VLGTDAKGVADAPSDIEAGVDASGNPPADGSTKPAKPKK